VPGELAAVRFGGGMSWDLWVKAFHVISVIAWMAGLLYLPRLFVYHAESEPGSAQSETFKVMERRLLRGIMNPAMIASYGFGLALFIYYEYWTEAWMWVKWAGILLLTVMHHIYALWRKDFAADRNTRSSRFYRMMNEVPTLAMIVIVVMVVVKPF
jgi:putative membrane protein